MRQKRKQDDPENTDRWVVSYADFITLLFAFFTTMYAISHVDQGKLERFSGSVKTAFRAAPVNSVIIEGIKPIVYADISLEEDIQTEFKKFGTMEGIIVTRDQRGVVVTFGDTVLFDSGSADPKRASLPLLSTIAALIKKTQRPIIIEGHTDNIPLRGSHYSSNLELSAARASHVFAILLEETAIDPARVTISGYGEFRPVASNATPADRARNRRVDFVFVTNKNGI